MVQWLRICFPTQRMWVLIPGQGTKIPHAHKPQLLSSCTKSQEPQLLSTQHLNEREDHVPQQKPTPRADAAKKKSLSEPLIYTRHLGIICPLGIFALSSVTIPPCFFQRWGLGNRTIFTCLLVLGGRKPQRACPSFVGR